MKNRMVTGTLALVAGIAIGWFAMPTGEPSVSSDKPSSSEILKKLVEASEIIDAEQQVMTVRAAFADAKAAEMETLADPVMKLAGRRPDMTLREEFLRCWGELAPQDALAYLGSESPLRDRAPVLTAWGRTDPDGAAESFQPPGEELSRDTQAEALLAGIAEADPVKAIRFADRFALADLTRLEFKSSGYFPSNPSSEPWGSYQTAIDNWIRHDPAGAFEVMISLKSSRVREQALNELFFYEWPNQDPEATQAAALRLWARAQLDGDSRVPLRSLELVKTLARNHGELNGAKAYEQAIALVDPDQRLAALKATLEGWKNWREEHLPAVADFVAMRLHRDVKASAESIMLVHAAEWTAGWLTENGENDEGIGKAAAWLAKLPPGAARDAAIRGIVSAWSWLPEQKKKLEEWVKTLPPSRQRDIAVATCVAKISEKESARAMDMAATIDDPPLRAEALAHVGARFFAKEEGGDKVFDVRKWMSENPKIGEELRAAAGRD